MHSAVLWVDIHEIAERAAKAFGLRWPIIIEPWMPKTRTKDSGQTRRGNHTPTILIRVHRYHRPRQQLKRSYILATLAHELAHCHPKGWEHGANHREITLRIARWMRAEGYEVAMNMLFHSPWGGR